MLKTTLNPTEPIDQKLKILIDKLKGILDKNNKLAEEYFSYLKDNKADFNDYLKFLEECVLSQLNEKYKGNEKKYGSEEEYKKYQNGLLGFFLDVDNYLRENYLLSDENFRKQYAEFMNKIDLEIKDSLDEKRFSWAQGRSYDSVINKLNTDIDNGKKFLKCYFLYLNEGPLRGDSTEFGFGNYLDFLEKVIIPQANEKYEGNEKKYGSKEKYEKYQNELFEVLVEVNDYLWENYLFLDRSLRLEYADKVISKIDGDCFKKFLYTRRPRKTELETPGDREKINAYNKVLDSFFYRNIRNLIFSEQQCRDLYKDINDATDGGLADDLCDYIYKASQEDDFSAFSGISSSNKLFIFPIEEKLKSFGWNEKLDKDNKMARECLEEIKKVSCPHKDFFDFYVNFLETAIISQINELWYKAKYYPDGKKDEKKNNKAKENYNKHQNQLLDILVETNDLIWEIINSISSSEYEKNRLSACYYNVIEKISSDDWERIGELLDKRKEEAIESRKKNKVAAYNKLVKSLILRNLENSVMSVDRINEMGVVNLIDEQTFEEYTDDLMVKKLFACAAMKKSRLGCQVRNSTIKIRKPDKNKKICLEAMFGDIMDGIHWGSADNVLSLFKKNSSDEIDFYFSSLSNEDVESSEKIKKFYLGFRSVYNDLEKNDFTVKISKPNLESIKCFMYLGSWIVPFFPKNVDFDTITIYTELNKRLNFLCNGHYGSPELEITQQQKDKLIIQALVYATNVLAPLSNDVKSVYRTLRMFTGEGKFVDGHKFSLDDMEKILSSTKNSVLNSFRVLKFCIEHRAKNVRIFDILRLAKKMNISIGGKRQIGCDVCLKDDRNGRSGHTGYQSISYNLFGKNDFEIFMSELLESPEEKEFGIWFPFFLTESILPKKRSSDQNKKIRDFFVQLVNKIPNGYLQLENFRSLSEYFVNENTENVINFTPYEFYGFILKINKCMNKEDFESFKAIIIKSFKIDGQEISNQVIDDAYNNVIDNRSRDTLSSIYELNKQINSFQWEKELDADNQIAKQCLTDIKKIECANAVKSFYVYIDFLEKAIVPQMNKFYGREEHLNGLFEILVEMDDLIWKTLDLNSFPEHEKKSSLSRYGKCIKKIDSLAWEKIHDLLYKRKRAAITSRDENKVDEYNQIVKNFIYRNLENKTIATDNLNWIHVVRLIDKKTFNEYTDDSMVKKLLDYAVTQEQGLARVMNGSTIKIRKPDKDKKICIELICGEFMKSENWDAVDDILYFIRNNPNDIDFDFSTIDQSMLKSNDNLENFFSEFNSLYTNLARNNFQVDTSSIGVKLPNRSKYLQYRKVFFYLGSWIIPLLGEKTDFNTAYKILSKRFDSLCANSKIRIDKQVKDKLIIQALVYATYSLSPLSEKLNEEKSIYRTLRMLTGEEKFVEGYKFSLDDIKKILLSAKNSVLLPIQVFRLCTDHRDKDVHLTDLIRLVCDMEVPLSGNYVCLEADRKRRLIDACYCTSDLTIFDRNNFETYITELPDNLKKEEFDIWFSIFKFRSIFNEERSSDENKKIQELFIKVVNKIPTEYLSKENFNFLANYFMRQNINNAINLTRDEFNKFMSEINKQMDQKDRAEFKRRMIKYFRIDGREISDQEIEDALDNVENPTKSASKNTESIGIDDKNEKIEVDKIVNESCHQNINMSAPIPVYPNINEVDQEANNFEENMAETPGPFHQNINEIAEIRVKIEELETRKLDLQNQITELKRDARELLNKNWLVQKFLGIFYYILNLIKKSKLDKIDKQIADLNEQLKTLQNPEKPKKSSDALSELEEEPVPNMQNMTTARQK